MKTLRAVAAVVCLGAATLAAQEQRLPPDYAARVADLERLRREKPAEISVLDALAGSYAMAAEYDKAAAVVEEMLAMRPGNPEWRLRLASLHAWGGKTELALAEVRSVEKSQLGPGTAAALETECQLLASLGNHSEAASCFLQLMRLTPEADGDRVDLQLKLARNQAWAGEMGAAIQSYRKYLKRRPDDRQATIELIRLCRYYGDYVLAEKLCDALLRANPHDAEVLAMKAEVLHWAGNRRLLASRIAKRAAELRPDLPDARVAEVYALRDLGENRAAHAEFDVLAGQVACLGLTPQSTYADAYHLLDSELNESSRSEAAPAYSIYNDSDGIHDAFAGVSVDIPVGDHKVKLNLGRHRSSAPSGSVFTSGRDASFVNEALVGAKLQAAPGTSVTIQGGASLREGEGQARPIFNLGVASTPFDRWTFELAAAREFFNLTPRAIDLDISSYKLEGDAKYALDARTSLAAKVSRRYWSDANRSMTGEAVLDHIVHYYKPFMIDAGALTRWESFERDNHFASGFFTPDLSRRHEAFAGLHGEIGRRLVYELRGAGGAQRIEQAADYRPSWEATSSASFKLARAVSLSGSYQRRNYSLSSRTGWYQGFYFSLIIRP